MHHRTLAAAGLSIATMVAMPLQAAQIDAQGAEALRSSLTHYLPEKLANSGFITVQPASRRYEIVMDFSKLLGENMPSDLSLTGLKPMSLFAEPADDGRWKVESGGYLDIAANYKVADVLNTMTYSVGNFSYAGVFDPAILYFRNGTFKAKDLKIQTSGGPEQIEARFGDMDYVMDSSEGAGGTVDVTASGTMSGFYEKIVTPTAPPVEINADSMTFDATVKGTMLKEIRDLVVFVLDNAKDDKLSPEKQIEFKNAVRKVLPLAGSIDENITVNNLKVATAQGEFGVKSLNYGLNMTGLTEATRFGVTIKARDPIVSSQILPATFMPLLPQETEFSFSMPDMNLGGFLLAALDKADFSRDEPLSDQESAELAKMIFPDGKVTINFDRIAAKSAAYDVEMTGVMKTYPDDSKRVSMEATILANDYDKTIAYFQEAAKTDPNLNQVSFGLMMVKGFAKADADGRQRWEVSVAEDGSVKVNGQTMKGPN